MQDRRCWKLEPGRLAKSSLTKKVATNIRMIRELHGLTQEELGKRLGRSKSTISRLESGTHSPTVENLDEVAAALGTQPAIFMTDDPTKARISYTVH